MQCKQLGVLVGGKWDKMMDVSRRVYSTETIAPTLHTCGGGNLEAKIMEEPKVKIPSATKCGFEEATIGDSVNIAYPNSATRRGRVGKGVAQTLLTGEEQAVLEPQEETCRVRKLTEKECFRLQGVKDEDFVRARRNQSKSSLYHLAGDSITTSVLMALFGEMLGIDWRSKVDDLAEDLSKERNIKNDTY